MRKVRGYGEFKRAADWFVTGNQGCRALAIGVRIMTNGAELTKTESPPLGCLAETQGIQEISPLSVVSLSGSTYARKTEGELFLDTVHGPITYVA